jgi:2,4-dienoyl-CoA reductase-like NADH-dependent reductase (Old Yellow Enzyme family)
MASLYDDTHIPGHRTLADAVHECGAGIVAQLAISSYCKESGGFVREEDINSLTQNDLDDIVTRFGDAAVRAKAVGYDGVQVHIAHFFFLSRCVSPLINHRSDRYGGNPAGRAGLVREIVAEIRRRTGPDFPLLAKVNGTDAYPGGVTREDLIAICREMESAGLDAVEVSGNNTSRTGIRPGRNEGYFLDYAKLVKENTGLQVISVGGFRSPEAVEDALHCVDFVSMSRPLINEPDLIRRWESGDRTPSRCISCNTCYTTYGHVCRFCKG